MELSNNTILITGGASGIGFALAGALSKKGNKVLICGRRKDRLEKVKQSYPEIDFLQCDVTDKSQRIKLYEWATSYGALNFLINNAGIQRDYDFTKNNAKEYTAGENEIDVNLTAPIHLCELFTPFLMKKAESAILNISSSLGIIHMPIMPVYCATKAGMHAFSRCLREQLAGSNVKVFEAVPPAVESELNPERRAVSTLKTYVPAAEYADFVIRGLETDTYEIYAPIVESLQNKTLKEVYEYILVPTNPR